MNAILQPCLDEHAVFRIRIFFPVPDMGKNLDADPDPGVKAKI